jgi:hypothetical protein
LHNLQFFFDIQLIFIFKKQKKKKLVTTKIKISESNEEKAIEFEDESGKTREQKTKIITNKN